MGQEAWLELMKATVVDCLYLNYHKHFSSTCSLIIVQNCCVIVMAPHTNRRLHKPLTPSTPLPFTWPGPVYRPYLMSQLSISIRSPVHTDVTVYRSASPTHTCVRTSAEGVKEGQFPLPLEVCYIPVHTHLQVITELLFFITLRGHLVLQCHCFLVHQGKYESVPP